MDDETTGNPASEAKNKTMPIIGEITEMAISMIAKKFPELAKTLGTSVDSAIELSSEFFGKSFKEKADDIGKEFSKSVEEHGKEAIKITSKLASAAAAGLEGALSSANLKETATDVMKSISDFVKNENNAVNVLDFWGAEKAAEKIKNLTNIPIAGGMLKSMVEMESRVHDISSGFTDSIAGMRGSFSAATVDAESMSQEIGTAISNIGKTMKDLGVTQAESKAGMDAFLRTGLAVGEIGKIEIGTHGNPAALEGLSAAMAIAKATGMDLNKVIGDMSKQMKTLGVEGENVDDIFSTIKATQEGSRLSFESVHTSLMSGAMNLKYYGTNVESLTGLFKTLNEGLGKGKENLTGELFQNTLAGLTGMDFSKKAFIASTTQMGEGRGVLGAGLQYEQNIEEGRIDKIFDAFKETISKFGGGSGEILTRKEAMDTGREAEYIQQRQIGAQFGAPSDPAQYEAFAKAMKVDSRKAEEFISKGEKDKGAGFAEDAKTILSSENGVLGSAVNRARGEAIEALGLFTSNFVESSKDISDAVTKFATNIRTGFVEGAGKSLEKAGIKHVEQDFSTADDGTRITRKEIEGVANLQDRKVLPLAMQETQFAYGQKNMESVNNVMPTVPGIRTMPESDYQLGQGLQFNFNRGFENYTEERGSPLSTIGNRNRFDTENNISANKTESSSMSVTSGSDLSDSKKLKQAIDMVGSLTLKIKLDNDGSVKLVTEDDLNIFKINLKSDSEDKTRNSVN